MIFAMNQQVREIRLCDNGHGEMQWLGKLPAIGLKSQIKVFRCYRCDRIASEPKQSLLEASKSA
jgi:hypothetical protein